MTIRLLKPYAQRPVGAIATFDASIEAGMIEAKMASADLAGGFEYFIPRPRLKLQVPQIAVGTMSLRAAEQAPITLPEGQALNVRGVVGTVGKVYRLDPSGGSASLQSWVIGAFSLSPIGPFVGQQRFLIVCSLGSVSVGASTARPQSRLRESNFLYDIVSGYLAAPVTVGANWYSELMQFPLPGDCDAMQITLLNADGSPVTGVKVSVGYGSTLGPANGTLGLAATGLPIGGSFTKCTQNGNATGTLSAASAISTGPSGANIGGSACGYGTFDLTYCPTVPRVDGNDLDKPIAYISISWPPGSKRTFLEMDGTTSVGWQNEGSQSARIAPFGRPRRVMTAPNHDAQDNPAVYLPSNGLAARTHTQYPAAIIALSLRGGVGKTLVVFGDSLRAGTSADIQYCGMAAELQALISTPSSPMTVANLAVPGSDMSKFLLRVQSLASIFSQANVLVPSATVNALGSPIAQSDLNLMRRSFAGMRKLLDRPGILMLTDTCPATGTAWKQYGSSDSLRVASNEYYMASGFPCLPFAEALAGPMVTVLTGPQAGQTQQSMAPKYTIDEIHPISPGYRAAAELAYPVWIGL